MGKATRWLRSLLGSSSKKPSSPVTAKDKKKLLPSSNSNSNWTHTTKFSDNSDRTPAGTTWSSDDPSPFIESLDANKHAIAVAAATAAVAEAALAAAQAAAEVVRLTSVGGSTRPVSSASASASASAVGGTTSVTRGRPRELAAVKIQSAFRAYLARRALRALKGLVKLQALVRGRIVRKQSADMLRRMQAMARIQARACAGRVPILGSANSQVQTSKFSRVGSSTSKGYDIRQGIYGSKHAEPNLKRGGLKSSISNNNINIEKMHLDSTWLERWMEESAWNSHQMETFKNGHLDDGNSDKILEIDTWKPRHGHRQSNKTFQAPQYFPGWKEQGQGTTTVFDPMSGLSSKFPKPNPSISSEEITSLNFPSQEDQQLPWAPDYSPRVHSATSRPGSSSRRGPFTPTKSECSRSLFGDYTAHPNYMANTESSLAKLRSQSAPRQRMQTEKLTGRKFVHGLWDMDTRSEKGSTPHTQLRSSDRLEMPVHGDTIGYNRIAYESRR